MCQEQMNNTTLPKQQQQPIELNNFQYIFDEVIICDIKDVKILQFEVIKFIWIEMDHSKHCY